MRAHVVGTDVDLGVGGVAHRVQTDVLIDPGPQCADEGVTERPRRPAIPVGPRANTTSTSGHAADAVGISIGPVRVAGASTNTLARTPATHKARSFMG